MAEGKNITAGQLVAFAEAADKRLDDLEANSAKGMALTLPADGWTEDSGDANYPLRCVLAVTGVTEASRADAVLDSASVAAAVTCGLCPVTETGAGTVIFKSYEAPAADLTGRLYITKVAAQRSTV